MKHIQNNQKSIPAYGFKNLKNPRTKSLETFAKCLWFPKENHTLGYEFTNL
jgi:hypothetical protein